MNPDFYEKEKMTALRVREVEALERIQERIKDISLGLERVNNTLKEVVAVTRAKKAAQELPTPIKGADIIISEINVPVPVRVRNCLANGGIKTIGELVATPDSELLKIKNCGVQTVRQARELQAKYTGGGKE